MEDYEIGAEDDVEALLSGDFEFGAARRQTVARGQGNRLVQKNPPTRLRQQVIGYDSTSTIAAAASSTLTQRPQTIFRPERLVVPATIALAFLITDIKVGKNSQLVAAGSIPAAAFSEASTAVSLKMDTCPVGGDISLSVTNFSAGAVRFLGALFGDSAE